MSPNYSSNGGRKDDSGKPELDYLPYEALVQVARVFSFGAQKYGKDNWKAGIEDRRLINAALRHLHKLADGTYEDEESGLPHAAHCIAGLMMLLHFRKDVT